MAHSIDFLLDLAKGFDLPGSIVFQKEIPTGLINRTYEIVSFPDVAGGESRRFILQSINSSVFSEPEKVMENIRAITAYLSQRWPNERQLKLIPRKEGQYWFTETDGTVWRCYAYLEETESISKMDSTDRAFQAGSSIARFQARLKDFDTAKLHVTIPHFHNAPMYYEKLLQSVDRNPLGRLHAARAELARIDDEKTLIPRLMNANLPTRVTHNDTKLSNILFPVNRSIHPIIIDLDTVMPGLSLFDYGDLVRSAVSSVDESERDISKVYCRKEIYQAIEEGYRSEATSFLTEEEISLLPVAPRVITLELAIRFLTDYLLGDLYFRTSFPEENLHRAKNQLALLTTL